MQKIDLVDMSNATDFIEYVNSQLADGWKISSTNCGFINSENYGFCGNYQAILVYEGRNE